jgi:hypothetical protein
MIEGLDGAGGEKSAQRTAAGWVVRFSIEFFRLALLRLAGTSALAADVAQVGKYLQRYPDHSLAAIDRVGDLLDRCIAADRQLDSNVTIPLCLEVLFDDLGRLLRA